jgi:hypothetical protein
MVPASQLSATFSSYWWPTEPPLQQPIASFRLIPSSGCFSLIMRGVTKGRTVQPDGTRGLQEPDEKTIKSLAARFLPISVYSSLRHRFSPTPLRTQSPTSIIASPSTSVLPILTTRPAISCNHASQTTKTDTSFRGQYKQTLLHLVQYVTQGKVLHLQYMWVAVRGQGKTQTAPFRPP